MTFLFYPVSALSENAHRVVVMYSKDEVIAQRRAAGLAVNLDGKEPPPVASATTSMRVAATPAVTEPTKTPTAVSPSPATKTIEPPVGSAPLTQPAQVTTEIAAPTPDSSRKSIKVIPTDSVTAAQAGLRDALTYPQRFTKWTAPRHGLTVSTAQVREIGEHSRLLVVAVRNTLPETLRLISGHPELLVQTYDENNRMLEVAAIKKQHVESSAIHDAIPAGATVYYAIVYEAPILGAHQQLRIAVGQTNAADEPLAADLTKAAR
jgi:hypothetical protein